MHRPTSSTKGSHHGASWVSAPLLLRALMITYCGVVTAGGGGPGSTGSNSSPRVSGELEVSQGLGLRGHLSAEYRPTAETSPESVVQGQEGDARD